MNPYDEFAQFKINHKFNSKITEVYSDRFRIHSTLSPNEMKDKISILQFEFLKLQTIIESTHDELSSSEIAFSTISRNAWT